jgi:hypothetical protein
MALKQQIQWQEPYVSYSLNRKMSGVLAPGVYRGFKLSPGQGLIVEVSPDRDAYPLSVAVVDRDGYNFTVTSDMAEQVTLPNDSEEWLICLNAKYIFGGGGWSQLEVVTAGNVDPGWLVLGRATIPQDTAQVTPEMLDETSDDRIKTPTPLLDPTAEDIGKVLTATGEKLATWEHNPAENILINGNFDIWQRGTNKVAMSHAYHTADRWQVGYHNALSGSVVSKRMDCGSQEYGTFQASFYMRTETSGVTMKSGVLASGIVGIQAIERFANYAGRTLTLSFWARACLATKIYFEYQVYTDSYTGPIEEEILFDIGTEWKKYTHTFTLPTMAVVASRNPSTAIKDWKFQVDLKTYFTDPEDIHKANPVILAELNAAHISTGWYDIAQVKLEEGPVATQFRPLPYDEELRRCQRYFFKTYDHDVVPGTPGSRGAVMVEEANLAYTSHASAIQFPSEMARIPTVAFYSTETGVKGRVRYSRSGVDVDIPVKAHTVSQRRLSSLTLTEQTYTKGDVSAQWLFWHLTADAEI